MDGQWGRCLRGEVFGSDWYDSDFFNGNSSTALITGEISNVANIKRVLWRGKNKKWKTWSLIGWFSHPSPPHQHNPTKTTSAHSKTQPHFPDPAAPPSAPSAPQSPQTSSGHSNSGSHAPGTRPRSSQTASACTSARRSRTAARGYARGCRRAMWFRARARQSPRHFRYAARVP